ncbi:MAG: phospholipase C [Acidimicrobiales bacterium]
MTPLLRRRPRLRGRSPARTALPVAAVLPVATVLLALTAAAVAPAAVAGAGTTSRPTVVAHHPAVHAATAKSSSAIQHVIIVIQSGHSFDNYFGTRPGVDGIPAGVCQQVLTNSKSCVKPYHLSSDQARAGLSDTLRVTGKAIDAGKMDGFVSAQPNASIGSLAMGHHDGSDLPYYWNLADRFTLFDHFYAASQAGTLPNRLAAVSGQTTGLTSNTPPASGISAPTVFDQLDQANLSWKYYVQGYPFKSVTPGERSRVPILAMPAVTGNPTSAAHVAGTGQYFTDLAAGHLPAVSYVASSSGDSERSPQSPAQGQAFVESLVNALMQSPEWSHTALLLTYDDSGGWYDNAVPPTVGGVTWGLRVPAILVSPYARAGQVDSQQLDTASIPGFIDQTFHLPPLTSQISTAGDLMSGLDLQQAPISPAIPSHVTLVGARPAVPVIYVLYLGALLAVGIVIALAFRRTRPGPGSSAPAGPGPAPGVPV